MAGDAVSEWLLAAARLLWYVGILGVIGASACWLLIASAVSPTDRSSRTAATAGLISAGALLAGVFFRLYAQTYAYFGLDEGVTRELLIEVATGLPPWSRGWLLQAGAATASAAALALAQVAPRPGWIAAHVAALAVAATTPMTGHAVAQEGWPRLPMVLQAGHVFGAGIWLGGLLVLLAVTARGALAAPASIAALVGRFSPVALAGAGLLVMTGAATAILYLDRVQDLWTTAYGGALLLKIGGFAAVGAAGFVNWRRIRPRIAEPGGVVALRQMAGLELGMAGVVLAVTAWLVGLPQP